MNRITGRTLAVSAALVLVASCGGSDDSADTTVASTEAPTTEPVVTEAPTTTAAPTTTEAPAGPNVEIVGGVTDFPADAETIVTVTGTGFTDLALGSRPPLDGIATGVYIVVGSFDEVWEPSAGAGAGCCPTSSCSMPKAISRSRSR